MRVSTRHVRARPGSLGRRGRRGDIGLLGAIAMALLLASAAPAVAQDGTTRLAAPAQGIEEQTPFERRDVRDVCEQIVCYCGCPHLQVSKCFCGTADAIREDVAAQLDAGMTADEIIAAYVEEHGTYGLASPPREGFNWVVWAGPFVLLLLGFVATVWMGRRFRTGEPELAVAGGGGATGVDPRHREALDRALERMD